MSCSRFFVSAKGLECEVLCALVIVFLDAVVFAFFLGLAAMSWVGCFDGSLPGDGGGPRSMARFLEFAGRRAIIWVACIAGFGLDAVREEFSRPLAGLRACERVNRGINTS